MTNTKPYDYHLHLQVSPHSPDRLLLEYLKTEQHLTYSQKEMVLAALRMCWLPLAYEQPNADRDILQRSALDAILRLREQIQYLSAIANLNPSLTQPDLRPIAQLAPPAPLTSIEPPAVRRELRPLAIVPACPSADNYEEDLFAEG